MVSIETSSTTSGFVASGPYASDLELALKLADAADVLTLSRFQALDLHVETKPDTTPVSDADLAAEALIRDMITAVRPDDAVIGEEQGVVGTGSRRWILDPIDGTKNFIRGVPIWATLIALEVDGEISVGVASAPALGRRWWASKGGGSYANGRKCAVSKITEVADASFGYASLTGWEEHGRLSGFLDLACSAWRNRGFGDFWSHCLVAEGAIDFSAEPEVSLWDIAPLKIIVEEAGGVFTDLDGEVTPYSGNIVCSNGPLHAEVLRRLAPAAQ
jgi:histidinol-phosphatase